MEFQLRSEEEVLVYVASRGSSGVWSIKDLADQWAVQALSTLSGFYLKGEEDILDYTSRAEEPQFPHAASNYLAWIIPPLLFFFFIHFVGLYVKKLIWATLTLGVFRQERRRWYPDVKVWRNLGSEKCAQACDVLSAICVMLLMWPLTVQPCDSLS